MYPGVVVVFSEKDKLPISATCGVNVESIFPTCIFVTTLNILISKCTTNTTRATRVVLVSSCAVCAIYATATYPRHLQAPVVQSVQIPRSFKDYESVVTVTYGGKRVIGNPFFNSGYGAIQTQRDQSDHILRISTHLGLSKEALGFLNRKVVETVCLIRPVTSLTNLKVCSEDGACR